LDNGRLVLAQIGRVAVRWSRPIEGTSKTVTICKEADGWSVCCSCIEVPTPPLPPTGHETGLDVGLTVFRSAADGHAVANPRHHRQAERALQQAQRRVSRRQQGRHRRTKAARRCAKRHQHVRGQRADVHYKTALALVRRYDTIDVEAIQPAKLSRRPAPQPDGAGGFTHNGAGRKAGLHKSLHDAGWGQFLTILGCTAAWAGTRVAAVPPAYTSQDCSGCGERIRKSRSVRTHVCPSCGLVLDRDENAARNIHWRGQRLRGLAAVAAGTNREPMGL
jgi:putative transposase